MSKKKEHLPLDDLLHNTLKGFHPPAPLGDMENMVMHSIAHAEKKIHPLTAPEALKSWKASWLSLFAGIFALVGLLFMNPGLQTTLPLFNDGFLASLILSGCLIAIVFQLSQLLTMRNQYKGISHSS